MRICGVSAFAIVAIIKCFSLQLLLFSFLSLFWPPLPSYACDEEASAKYIPLDKPLFLLQYMEQDQLYFFSSLGVRLVISSNLEKKMKSLMMVSVCNVCISVNGFCIMPINNFVLNYVLLVYFLLFLAYQTLTRHIFSNLASKSLCLAPFIKPCLSFLLSQAIPSLDQY